MKSLSFYLLFSLLLKPIYCNNLALPCYGCHKNTTTTQANTIPNIIGLDQKYFINAFNEYKNNIRENYLMQIISKGYSDLEIEELSEYFGNIGISND